MRRIYCYLSLLLLVVACSPSVDYDPELDGDSNVVRSILALKELYVSGVQLLTDDIVITGSITANNLLGEFPYSIVIEDDSAAIEISVDQSEGVGRYLLGGELTMVCSGLYMASEAGSMILGTEPSASDDYIVGEISESEMLSRATISTDEVALREPQVVKISELTETMASCYVAIEDVTIVPYDTGGTVCVRDPDTGRFVSTTHTAVDADGDTINIYVPSTVTYANMSITSSVTTLYGIVDLYGGYYSLRLISGFTSLMNF